MATDVTDVERAILYAEMTATAREEWGEGFVDGFYENLGATFTHTAMWFIDQVIDRRTPKEAPAAEQPTPVTRITVIVRHSDE